MWVATRAYLCAVGALLAAPSYPCAHPELQFGFSMTRELFSSRCHLPPSFSNFGLTRKFAVTVCPSSTVPTEIVSLPSVLKRSSAT